METNNKVSKVIKITWGLLGGSILGAIFYIYSVNVNLFNLYGEVSVGERNGDVLAPLRNTDAASCEVIVKSRGVQIVLIGYAVHIKMVYGAFLVTVLIDERKRGGSDRRAFCEYRRKAAHECGLADTEVSVHSDKAGKRAVSCDIFCKLRAERFCLGGGACCFFYLKSHIRKVP